LAHESRVHGDQLSPKLCELVAQGVSLSPQRYDQDRLLARRCRQRLDDLFREADILVAPSAPGEAPEGLTATGNPVFNRIWTLLGTPCVHLPCALGPHGLPLGVQAVGPRGADHATLAAADWAYKVLRTTDR
jgi:amidase